MESLGSFIFFHRWCVLGTSLLTMSFDNMGRLCQVSLQHKHKFDIHTFIYKWYQFCGILRVCVEFSTPDINKYFFLTWTQCVTWAVTCKMVRSCPVCPACLEEEPLQFLVNSFRSHCRPNKDKKLDGQQLQSVVQRTAYYYSVHILVYKTAVALFNATLNFTPRDHSDFIQAAHEHIQQFWV